MKCTNCENGFMYDNVTRSWRECNICEGTTEINPCNNFTKNTPLGRCIYCGCWRSQHVLVPA